MILIRTAEIDCSICVDGGVPVFQTGGECSIHSCCKNCWIVQWFSISEFDSEDVGSNPAPTTDVGFSLSGKVPHCECGEQGSSPGVNQYDWV